MSKAEDGLDCLLQLVDAARVAVQLRSHVITVKSVAFGPFERVLDGLHVDLHLRGTKDLLTVASLSAVEGALARHRKLLVGVEKVVVEVATDRVVRWVALVGCRKNSLLLLNALGRSALSDPVPVDEARNGQTVLAVAAVLLEVGHRRLRMIANVRGPAPTERLTGRLCVHG